MKVQMQVHFQVQVNLQMQVKVQAHVHFSVKSLTNRVFFSVSAPLYWTSSPPSWPGQDQEGFPVAAALSSEDWDNLWESQGGSMVNGAHREFPQSAQCTP